MVDSKVGSQVSCRHLEPTFHFLESLRKIGCCTATYLYTTVQVARVKQPLHK